MSQRKKIIIAFAAAVLLSVTFAIAGAHFLQCSGSQNGNNFVASFREAGLGNGNVHITLTADATAHYACYNNGGKNPKAQNKRTVHSAVQSDGTFKTKNGSVSGTLTLTPPSAGDFTCPPGQTLRLVSVTYSNVVITDTDNNVSCSP